MAYYDGTSWVSVPSTVDTVNHTITAIVDHFSWWAVVLRVHTPTPTPTRITLDVPNVVIYPNPSDGTDPVRIYVPGLTGPSKVNVKVMTLSFREVYDQTFMKVQPGTALTIPMTDQWNKPLANGLYYVVATTAQGRTMGKCHEFCL